VSRTIKTLFGADLVAQDWETDAGALNRYYTLRVGRGDFGAEIQAWRCASFFAPTNAMGLDPHITAVLDANAPKVCATPAAAGDPPAGDPPAGAGRSFIILGAVLVLAWVLFSSR
jgi:hypothetical protein